MKSSHIKAIIIIFTIATIICAAGVYAVFGAVGSDTALYIPSSATNADVRATMCAKLGKANGLRLYYTWRLAGGEAVKAHGYYDLSGGMSYVRAARRIAQGRQTPIRLTFNNIRTVDNLAERLAGRMEWSADEFMAACDSILPSAGFNRAGYAAAFLPDTYEVYWTDSPAAVVTMLLGHRNRFWSDERRAKAAAHGLRPVEVATVASIVEEESNNAAERPLIARLYLNRLAKGMPLQADPTVKFAVGDFSLRRITGRHIAIDSPYNTYRVKGLPPGPIRIADARTIDAVLDAPDNNYIYMCAREDFSGTHRFTADYNEHLRNAAAYRKALDAKGIK